MADKAQSAYRLLCRLIVIGCCLTPGLAVTVIAAPDDWAEGVDERFDGANRYFFNRGARLRWQHSMGDWSDAGDQAQGDRAYATGSIAQRQKEQDIYWDITGLVRQWHSAQRPNQGLFLRRLGNKGVASFRSRETADSSQAPKLALETDKGAAVLTAVADTFLNPSTFKTFGAREYLAVGDSNTLIRFDLSVLPAESKIISATLRLYKTKQTGAKTMTIGVFRATPGVNYTASGNSQPQLGIAAASAWDRNIAQHPSVLMAADFEQENWKVNWTRTDGEVTVVASLRNESLRYEPLQGRALQVNIAKGQNYGMNMAYVFRRALGYEPQAVYLRYYLRLAHDWNQTAQGGKLPGISGTYGVAGWGGRKADGFNGWSARGTWLLTLPPGNPLAGRTPISFYCYHMDQEGSYGDIWVWSRDYLGYLEKNRWYSIEQYIRLNTPGQRDGIARGWVDGRLAFERTDIRFRQTDKLNIEEIWMNVWHGGTAKSPYDQHLYIDNVVIAQDYIGPMISD